MRNYIPKPFNSASIDIIRVTRRDSDSGDQRALKKNRVSLRCVYVWGINSTVNKAGKNSNYFVWKDTSMRMTHAVTTPVDKTRVNSWAFKHLFFLKEVSNKKIAKNPGKCSLWRATNSMFSKSRGCRRYKKCGFSKRASRGFN